MNSEPKARSPRIWEVTVESDWVTMIATLLLFLICGSLLVREIRHFIWGDLSAPVPLYKSFWGIWNKVFEAIAAIFCFTFGFSFPKKSARIAWTLTGIYLARSFLLSLFHLSLSVQHIAAASRSALWQITLAISCVAIVDWFRSVVRWSPPSVVRGGNS